MAFLALFIVQGWQTLGGEPYQGAGNPSYDLCTTVAIDYASDYASIYKLSAIFERVNNGDKLTQQDLEVLKSLERDLGLNPKALDLLGKIHTCLSPEG